MSCVRQHPEQALPHKLAYFTTYQSFAILKLYLHVYSKRSCMGEWGRTTPTGPVVLQLEGEKEWLLVVR